MAISNCVMVDSHGRYCSIRMTVLHALSKQPLDDLRKGVGFVDLLGLGVVGVVVRKRAPYDCKVRYGGGVTLAISVDVSTTITAT